MSVASRVAGEKQRSVALIGCASWVVWTPTITRSAPRCDAVGARGARRRGGPTTLLGGLEAGGTKLVCAVGTGPGDLRAEARLPTTSPGETLERAVAFFRDQASQAPLAALGIASFGPVDLDPRSATWGFITTTPKPGWVDTDLAGTLGRALGVPVGFDTDVNGAALAEHRWGALQGCDPAVYVTVGTGIGGGAIVNGRPLHGAIHPEMGHLRIPRAPDDGFAGMCPYHGDCLEGLATAGAMRARWGAPPESLPSEHPAWDLEARYLALGLAAVVAVLSPQRIVLGGGVTGEPTLLPRVRTRVRAVLGGYLRSPVLDQLDRYVVAPGLGDRAGVLGALALAADVVVKSDTP
jgi:fructokinase